MKKVLLTFALIAFAFTTSVGYAENTHPVKDKADLFVVSSNHP